MASKETTMPGIYIHIPFCKQACHYCDFHFSTSLNKKDAFLGALKREMELQKNYLDLTPSPSPKGEGGSTSKISTIYLGGGTPSLLTQVELMNIFDSLHKNFNIADDAEITLEANPDDLSEEKLKQLKDTPVNRLSIGIQSFFDVDLKLMNRAHSSQEASKAVRLAQKNGFKNITIDLIYGVPTLTHTNWKKNLQNAFDLDVKHISAYCLTVEPKTALAKFIQTGKIKNVNEQHSAEQFEIMIKLMNNNGFRQYEISNFCKDNLYSRHNSNYWLKESYLGLGPSAHSYNGKSRQWNISNNALYIQSLEKNELCFEEEILTAPQRYNEYILTSLRTMWGTDLKYIEQYFGKNYFGHCLMEAERYIQTQDIINKENKLILSDKGKLIADKIASDLFQIA
ncbi:MAG: radical SAM family heme chaperone HemW [Bacteroidota bacterium]